MDFELHTADRIKRKYILREQIASVFGGDLLSQLLTYRNIVDFADRDIFLHPSYNDHLHDPYLLRGMSQAVARIKQALKHNEHIIVYADYDADGIPGAVVLNDFFKLIGYSNFEIYIPHRHREGFGLHSEAIDTFVTPALLISVDCGITDSAEVARAQNRGIDVIITDHHTAPETLPSATAIVDPKQPGCEYPFRELCGAGIVFKLIQALLATGEFKVSDGAEKWFLDMVGLATLSDMVPLVDENRVLAHYGLMVLRKSRRPGLRALLRLLRIDQRFLTEDDIGFMITPRLNAASRMGEPIDAFTLLATTDTNIADAMAAHLNRINDERKGLVGSLVKEVKKIMIERAEHFKTRQVIVLGNPLWRPAILGLAAGSLAESAGKPVFLWGREEGVTIKGSCRSGGSASVVSVMKTAQEISAETFIDFGGHHFSGGFSLEPDKVHSLEDTLEKAFATVTSKTITVGDEEKQQANTVLLDGSLRLTDVRHEVYELLEQLAPFGIANPKPIFLFKDVMVKSLRQFGKLNNHLEIIVSQADADDVQAIRFFTLAESFKPLLEIGKKIDLVATMEKSFFRSRPTLRLRIVDIV